MKLLTPVALFSLALAAHAQTAPAAPARPAMPLLDAATISARCDGELAAWRKQLQSIAARRGGDVFADMNALSLKVADFLNPVYLLQNVAPDKATRDAAQACLEKLTPFSAELFQNVPLFERVKIAAPKDAVGRQYRKDLLESFEDSGAALPPAKRARAKEILDELERLSLEFQKNVNEYNATVTITPAEAKGLPQSWIDARKRDDKGNLIVTLDYPSYLPFLELADNGDARRRVWFAKSQEGGQRNLDILKRVIALRYELAQLHGEPDFATLQLKRRMAGNPKAVSEFLAQVRAAATPLQAREFDELRAEKAKLTGTPLAETKLYRWDIPYLLEKVKKARYSVDQEALRAYFPTEASVQFTKELARRLYSVDFVARDVPVWSKDVQYFDVYDRKADGTRGAFLGGIYLDLFPRDGKYNHAAVFPLFPGSTLAGRTPVAVLVANLNAKGLNHDELETLLHEYGHALHGVLSQTRYADQSGTAVKRDFVEAPSQMFEEWARREAPLAVFAEVCPTCPRLTKEQIAQLDAARKFGRGNFFARQGEFARYDLKLHTGKPGDPMQEWIAVEQAGPLGYVEGSMFPASFGHILGGYASGYYGYMWSQVLALDMLAAFNGQLMDPVTGRRYRDTILRPGGEQPPAEMVERFLGRKPNSDAFYAEIAGKR